MKESRGTCFDDIIEAIEQGKLVGNIKHFNSKKYPNQYFYLINMDNYIYVVPYVKDIKKKEIYLKTVYPSRKFTKMYRRKE